MSGNLRFTTSGGVLGVLAGANSTTRGCEIVVGGGDLHQMSVQSRFLRGQGMTIGHVDVYPSVRTEEEKVQALRLLWEHKVEGWWNLEHDFIRAGICTQEEFDMKLGRVPYQPGDGPVSDMLTTHQA